MHTLMSDCDVPISGARTRIIPRFDAWLGNTPQFNCWQCDAVKLQMYCVSHVNVKAVVEGGRDNV